MAVGNILLPIAAAILPDGSTSNAAATVFYEKSTSSPNSNCPNVWQIGLAFTQVGAQKACWQLQLPADFNSTQAGGYPIIRIKGSCVSTTSTVTMYAGQDTAIDGSGTAMTALVYANADISASINCPGTASQQMDIPVALTNTNMAANRHCCVFISRNNSGTSADFKVRSVNMEYTTT